MECLARIIVRPNLSVVNRKFGEVPQAYHTSIENSGTAGEDGKYGLDNYLLKQTFYVNFS